MKSSKKILTLALAGIIGLSLFTACGNTSNDKEKEVKLPTEINMTYVKAPLNVPSIIEKSNESFDKEFESDGIDIKWHEITSGPNQTQALAADELQFLHALGGTSAILAASNGVDLKIINVYSRAPKAFMIISKDEKIVSPSDLKGKKIGGPKGTVLHQLLLGALDQNELSQEDIEFINMGIPDAVAALNSGSIDAALLAGPAALKTISAGGKVVADGEGIVEGTIVTATSGKFASEHPEMIERFKKVHGETVKYITENLDEAMEITSNEVGLDVESTKEMYSWYDFDMTIRDEDVAELKRTQEFLISNKLQQNEINIDDLVIR